MSAAKPFEFLSGQTKDQPGDAAVGVGKGGTEGTEIETGTDDTAARMGMGGTEGTQSETGTTSNVNASDIQEDNASVTEARGDSEGEGVEPVVRNDLDSTVMDIVGSGAAGDSGTGQEKGSRDKLVEEGLGGTAINTANGPIGDVGTEQEKDETSNVVDVGAGVVGKTQKERRKQQPDRASVGQTLRRSIRHNGAKDTKEQDTNPTPTLPSKRANLDEDLKEEPPSKRSRNTGNGKKSKKRT
ncbi:hypothetical protein K435DRAFT_791769 [Dendrothele bispora CBS 962.96]|nr:hypothetical protein K435DRAFT_791769 [Dendrothele bispora CBS 962.96]